MPTANHKMLTIHSLDICPCHQKCFGDVLHVHIVAPIISFAVNSESLAIKRFANHHIEYTPPRATGLRSWPVDVRQTQNGPTDGFLIHSIFQIIFSHQFMQVVHCNWLIRMVLVYWQASWDAHFGDGAREQHYGLQSFMPTSF